MKINEKMAKINEDLKATKTGIKVRRRNKRLYLQGTLPPKPGKENKGHHQQEISLGLEANEESLKKAKDEAIALSFLLKTGRFDWNLYCVKEKKQEPQELKLTNTLEAEPIETLIERFKQWYLKKLYRLTILTFLKIWTPRKN